MASWASFVASGRVSSPVTQSVGMRVRLLEADNFVAHILVVQNGIEISEGLICSLRKSLLFGVFDLELPRPILETQIVFGHVFVRMEAFPGSPQSHRLRLRKVSLITVCPTQLMRTEA